ncbi:MAG: chromate transporter, partial [Defluviicoccus sp.]|nr:chromate transporter [Defluviicoccus sp.]
AARPGIVPALALVLFFAFLVLLPVAAAAWPSQWLALADSFYRSGALTFGGGHVVLPLLEAEVLPPGWVTRDAFLAGYGAAQALPGPLFTFAAYLGAVMEVPPSGWRGALICIAAIFLPSFLLVAGTLPWWTALSRLEAARRAMPGIGAAVVGLLLAALYDPVWTEGVRSAGDFVLALAAFVLLAAWKAPPWLVVLLGAAAGWGMAVVAG